MWPRSQAPDGANFVDVILRPLDFSPGLSASNLSASNLSTPDLVPPDFSRLDPIPPDPDAPRLSDFALSVSDLSAQALSEINVFGTG